jgi:hypothetical protein
VEVEVHKKKKIAGTVVKPGSHKEQARDEAWRKANVGKKQTGGKGRMESVISRIRKQEKAKRKLKEDKLLAAGRGEEVRKEKKKEKKAKKTYKPPEAPTPSAPAPSAPTPSAPSAPQLITANIRRKAPEPSPAVVTPPTSKPVQPAGKPKAHLPELSWLKSPKQAAEPAKQNQPKFKPGEQIVEGVWEPTAEEQARVVPAAVLAERMRLRREKRQPKFKPGEKIVEGVWEPTAEEQARVVPAAVLAERMRLRRERRAAAGNIRKTAAHRGGPIVAAPQPNAPSTVPSLPLLYPAGRVGSNWSVWRPPSKPPRAYPQPPPRP